MGPRWEKHKDEVVLDFVHSYLCSHSMYTQRTFIFVSGKQGQINITGVHIRDNWVLFATHT